MGGWHGWWAKWRRSKHKLVTLRCMAGARMDCLVPACQLPGHSALWVYHKIRVCDILKCRIETLEEAIQYSMCVIYIIIYDIASYVWYMYVNESKSEDTFLNYAFAFKWLHAIIDSHYQRWGSDTSPECRLPQLSWRELPHQRHSREVAQVVPIVIIFVDQIGRQSKRSTNSTATDKGGFRPCLQESNKSKTVRNKTL